MLSGAIVLMVHSSVSRFPSQGKMKRGPSCRDAPLLRPSFLSWLHIYQARCPCHKSCVRVWLLGNVGLYLASEAGEMLMLPGNWWCIYATDILRCSFLCS